MTETLDEYVDRLFRENPPPPLTDRQMETLRRALGDAAISRNHETPRRVA